MSLARPPTVKLEALTMFTGAKDQDKSQYLDHWAIVLSAQHTNKND